MVDAGLVVDEQGDADSVQRHGPRPICLVVFSDSPPGMTMTERTVLVEQPESRKHRSIRYLNTLIEEHEHARAHVWLECRSRRAFRASDHVHRHRQLIRHSELGDQACESLTQIVNRLLARSSLAVRANAGP
jgi:hypothetical protein